MIVTKKAKRSNIFTVEDIYFVFFHEVFKNMVQFGREPEPFQTSAKIPITYYFLKFFELPVLVNSALINIVFKNNYLTYIKVGYQK